MSVRSYLNNKFLYDIVIYHDHCSDGLACKWIILPFCKPKTKFIGVCTGMIEKIDINDFKDKTVIFADLIPTFKQFNILKQICSFLTIIDHHLGSLSVFDKYTKNNINNNINNTIKVISHKYSIRIDTKLSACQMAWDYFNINIPRPWTIDYIGDRDLYRFELENSKEINIAMYKMNLINIEGLNKMINYKKINMDNLIKKGKEYLKEEHDICEKAIINAQHLLLRVVNKTYNVWSVNTEPHMRSSVGNYLCSVPFKNNQYPDFVIVWRKNNEATEYWISLRGIGKVNLDIVANKLEENGHGHFDAAGCTLTNDEYDDATTFISNYTT